MKTYIHRTPYMNVYNSLISNSQNLEASQMSYTEWMDKQTMWYILPVENYSEKEWTFVTIKIWMDLKDDMLNEKKAISKGYVVYYSIYKTFSKWKIFSDGEQGSSCEGVGKTVTLQGWHKGVSLWRWNSPASLSL